MIPGDALKKPWWGIHNQYHEATLWQGLRVAHHGWQAGFRSQREDGCFEVGLVCSSCIDG